MKNKRDDKNNLSSPKTGIALALFIFTSDLFVKGFVGAIYTTVYFGLRLIYIIAHRSKPLGIVRNGNENTYFLGTLLFIFFLFFGFFCFSQKVFECKKKNVWHPTVFSNIRYSSACPSNVLADYAMTRE